MDKLFITDSITTSVSVEPRFLNKKLDSFILQKIKEKYEGTCIKHGYIKPDSIKFINRSMGKINSSHFNGNTIFDVKISLELCNPPIDTIIEAQVVNINKMGIIADIPYENINALNILLPRQYHIDNENFINLSINDIIPIKIIGKRFEYGDTQISIIAILQDESNEESNNKSNEDSNEESN